MGYRKRFLVDGCRDYIGGWLVLIANLACSWHSTFFGWTACLLSNIWFYRGGNCLQIGGPVTVHNLAGHWWDTETAADLGLFLEESQMEQVHNQSACPRLIFEYFAESGRLVTTKEWNHLHYMMTPLLGAYRMGRCQTPLRNLGWKHLPAYGFHSCA